MVSGIAVRGYKWKIVGKVVSFRMSQKNSIISGSEIFMIKFFKNHD